VDYADAVTVFFVSRPEGTALPAAVTEGSPARRLRDACEPVAMHAVWSRAVNERLAQLGLTKPGWRTDVWPGAGIAAAGYGAVLVLAIALAPLIRDDKQLFSAPAVGHLPDYYIVYGIVIAAVSASAEEILVSGYLLTRLEQLGWNPRRALVLSLTLRTSYHVYYGLGFLLTIPFGYFATRSFQKHRRLMPPIIAHFLYDAVLFTIAVLAS